MVQIVVVGTDTDVGKSVFAAGLTRMLDASYWKPVQAGLDDGGDTKRVQSLAMLPNNRLIPEAYLLSKPLSPHLAAEIDSITIKTEFLKLPDISESLIIEGAGGLCVPLTRKLLYIDLIATWKIPVVLVGRTIIGAINHALLSIQALKLRHVKIIGMAFVGNKIPDTENTICKMGGVKKLGCLPFINPLNPKNLHEKFMQNFNISDFQI